MVTLPAARQALISYLIISKTSTGECCTLSKTLELRSFQILYANKPKWQPHRNHDVKSSAPASAPTATSAPCSRRWNLGQENLRQPTPWSTAKPGWQKGNVQKGECKSQGQQRKALHYLFRISTHRIRWYARNFSFFEAEACKKIAPLSLQHENVWFFPREIFETIGNYIKQGGG
jgi:hypothetical protein